MFRHHRSPIIVGTVALDGWADTFGTVGRGLAMCLRAQSPRGKDCSALFHIFTHMFSFYTE